MMKCAAGKFTLLEQIWMQVSINGIWILGTIAMWQESPLEAIAYILFVWIGIFFFIMHLWICPNCPHIKEYHACVQLPPVLTKWLIKKESSGILMIYEKIGFYIILYGVFLIPLYWVVKQPLFFVPYFIFGLMHYPAYFLRFCKRCYNISCPQNMNKATS